MLSRGLMRCWRLPVYRHRSGGQECQRTQPLRARLGLRLGDERQPVQDEIRHLRTTMMPFTAS